MRSTKRTTITITVICLVGLLSFHLHAEPCNEWPMLYNNPQHTNYTECKLPSEMEVLWSRRTGGVIRSSPIIADNKLYIVLGDHNLYCLNAETGEKRWEYEIGGELSSLFLGESSSFFLGKLSPSPCVINGKVYVGSLNGNIYCIDAETGKKRWRYQTGGVVQSSPIVVDSKLYIGSADHHLYCLNAETGEKLWRYETDNAVYSSPSFYNNRVYVASGSLYCLDAFTGEELWRRRMETTDDPILISGGKLYAAGYTTEGNIYGGIYCLDTKTGKTIWKNTDIKVPNSLSFGNERLYLNIWMDKASSIYCLDAGTGKVLWRYTERGDATFFSLVVANDKLYIRVTPSYLYCIDAETGEKRWEYKEDLLVWHTPLAIANGKIYAASSNIYCIGPRDDSVPLYLGVLILAFSLVGVLLWKKGETLKKLNVTYKLMMLIGIFSLSPVALLWFQEAVSFTEWFTFFTILYCCLIAIS
ncbi:MAG: PQQ-binding-like beta-propeller repeat protein, partial [Euryarchaeota archaeon]|nr:PQQ-binding-like beta-propeller repeat protein [Euryarchaeota archaeon]